ncbi:uncharacterized protein LOC124285902 [Haliotis rubra]|uniref:uncharacterized protein LOC124285902 n=1 Tax=Haliotis rubra TaxID=36100 RepID=UPI001EE5FDD0|nr:uncharacterized protein LOC124285902 [Haliotis rubra]
MLLSNAIPSMHTPNTGPQLQYFPQPAPAPVKSHCKGNSFIEIGLRNECELQTDDLGYNYFTQIWESTDIAFVHIGDATSDNRAKITITSMEQDFKTERRFFQTFKDNQCVIPLNGALLTSEEEGSIILDLKLDSAISMQDFLQHKLKEILTCLLSIVKDKLRLNVRVDSQFSVDVKDGLSGHRGEPAVTKSKTVTEKEIQTKLTWIKSTPTMIHSPSPSDLPPNMSNKETPPTNLMDTPSPSETASLSSTPSKSDDDTEKVMKKAQNSNPVR